MGGGGSRGSSDAEPGEIQVETHIQVEVEGGGGRLSGWRTPQSESVSRGGGSMDSLVKDVKDVV